MREPAWEEDLNAEQLAAVRHGEGPILVLAGAGSGKTRVLTYRFARLVRGEGIPAGRILAVTFTNKAAAEMRERIEGLVGESTRRLWVGTFHATGVRILRESGEAIGVPRNFTILDADDQKRLLKAVCREEGLDPSAERIERALGAIRRRKGSFGTDSRRPRSMGRAGDEADFLFGRYEAARVRLDALDFDDLLEYPVRLFAERKDVLEAHASRFEHVLVDEFQDTNRIQNEMIRLLSSVHGNVCAVGDDDQSIYGWRGADVGNILRFEESFPGARVVRLERNYRSTAEILEAAHAVIRNNRGRRGKKLWTDRKGGERIGLRRFRSEREEGLYLAHEIGARIRGGLSGAGDVAIFYRTNAQSRAIEDALRAYAIPYTIVGGTRFYERREVKDALAYLRILVNPRDDLSTMRVWNVPSRGIGERSQGRMKAFAAERKISLLEACSVARSVEGIPPRAGSAFEEFAGIVRRYTERSRSEAPDRLVKDLVDELALAETFEEKEGLKGEARGENVREFVSAVADFGERNPDALIADFLAEVSLLSDLDSWEESPDAVTLMTLHNSKGLEFPDVFIAGVEEGLLPHLLSTTDDEEIEEERRLFYVGLTRAKNRVVLTHTTSRLRYGEVAPASPSRFLDEIPGELLEEEPLLADAGSGIRRRSAPGGVEEGRFPDYENESQEELVFRKGDRIRHAVWGVGLVDLVEGSGADTKLTIRFRKGFTKKVLVRFAVIERL